jgi:NAD(P) transhydrogenase subunit beta
MTSMPEFVAFFNGLGGLPRRCSSRSRSAARGGAAARSSRTEGDGLRRGADSLAVIIGSAVTLSGSIDRLREARGQAEQEPHRALGLAGRQRVARGRLHRPRGVGRVLRQHADGAVALQRLLALASLLLGVGLTHADRRRGHAGRDRAAQFSYSGIAGMTTGFMLKNNLLIVAGSLVGASGIILTQIMCKAMNRSLSNVLLGGMGETAAGGGAKDEGYTKVKTTSAEELAALLDAATSVIFVPGYGLAVAQAQHKVRELAALLEKKGCLVRYAIHPVAGRMPGHMNILLAEADVPYEQLYELDRINDDFKNTDVVVVLGANDVCNPAAINDPKSPIAGMPVLTVWNARTVVVVKRSLASGYAGIRNELFQMDNSLMLLADAKKALEDTITELKAL